MANLLAPKKPQYNALAAQMNHASFVAPYNPIGTGLQQWMSSAGQRISHPLETLAAEANRWRNMPVDELAGNLVGVGATVGTNVKKLASLLDQSGIPYDISKSAKSPSTYFKIQKPDGDLFSVRISDHHDYHLGGDVSIDPETGLSFADAIKQIQNQSIPIKSRKISTPKDKKIIDDETIVKIFHGGDSNKTISDVPVGVVNSWRENYIWKPVTSHPSGGYWTEKK